MNVITQTLDSLIDRLSGPIRVDPAQAIAEKVFEFRPGAVPGQTAIAELALKQSDHARCFEAAHSTFTDQQAHAAFALQTEAHGKLARAGRIAETRTRGLESLLSEYRAKRQAANSEADRVCREAYKITKPLLSQFVEALSDYITSREASEKAECKGMGLEFVPSPILLFARKICASYQYQLKNDSCQNAAPKDQLRFVNLE